MKTAEICLVGCDQVTFLYWWREEWKKLRRISVRPTELDLTTKSGQFSFAQLTSNHTTPQNQEAPCLIFLFSHKVEIAPTELNQSAVNLIAQMCVQII